MHVHFDSIFGTLFWRVLPNATNVENNFLAIPIWGTIWIKCMCILTLFLARYFGKFWQMQPMRKMNLLASEIYRIKAGIPLFGFQVGSTNPYHLTLHSCHTCHIYVWKPTFLGTYSSFLSFVSGLCLPCLRQPLGNFLFHISEQILDTHSMYYAM